MGIPSEQQVNDPETNDQYKTQPAVMPASNALALITHPDYQNAISFRKETDIEKDNSGMLILPDDIAIKFVDGKLYVDGINCSEDRDRVFVGSNGLTIGESVLQERSTNKRIKEINVALIVAIYSVIYNTVKNMITIFKSIRELDNYVIEIPFKEFAVFIGLDKYADPVQRERVMNDFNKLFQIVGLIDTKETKSGRRVTDKYPLLVFMYLKNSNETIGLCSPYLNAVVRKMIEPRYKLNPITKKPVLGKNEEPIMLPVHSYMIKSSITSARNKRAVEIVSVVVRLIEQAGPKGGARHTPHINAASLVYQCPELFEALSNSKNANNQNIVLRRAFSRAWEYLGEYTYLQDNYKNIQFPEEIPTMGRLKDITFRFPHDGKIINR